ncbi:efflux RND transporter periplasmic adaptor subunit [Tenacibaculum ovolyticum]|uniref:efflux RND transporter periplasmic adaptor subunit n=1 Tax=Tenacibaculum ovolyticum TaxID=104270 RepID=UPI0022F3B056|nr:efflux RND transporter periplasmic adaptor subunit [Tenacibaculum ovolyticum]WBX77074.1 efflux RND transporter periplasmic adaptor subunit [Tenacibaculum ovolyticum]
MKKIYTLLTVSLILLSCGKKEAVSVEELVSEGTIKELRTRKTEITTNLEAINIDLKAVNDAISKLDTVKKLPLITTIVTKEEVFNHYLELQGNVKTKQNVLVYPEMPGILRRVYVKEGQRVAKGQLLATIDDGGLSQQIAQLKIQEQLSKTTYERQKRLWDQKIGSEIQFLQAKASYEAQTNAVKQLRRQQGKSVVRAPFSGVIDDVMKEPGTVLAPGQGSEIFRVVNLNNMYIEAEVPESYIKNVTKGKKVEVFFPVLGKIVEAKIRQVGNFINPSNRAFKVEIYVPNKSGDIKPNLTARLKINDYTSEKAILIPQSIISENAEGEQYVYLVGDKKENKYATANKTIIETGKTQGDVIEVLNTKIITKKNGVSEVLLKPMNAGFEVISEGARSVNDGQKVEIKN